MNVYYTGNGCFMTTDELYHYGVPGMKWGKRKAVPAASTTKTGQNRAQADRNSPEAKAARIAKAKKVAKIGAAVAGTALAAYGTYKLAKYVQGKRQQAAMQKASDYLDAKMFRKVRDTTFRDGTREFDFRDGLGNRIVTGGSRSEVGKYIGRENAKTMATARKMYRDATSTRLDKGLARVTDTGDAIGDVTRRAADSVSRTANKAARKAGAVAGNVKESARKTTNKVLDVVNPVYEYTPRSTTTSYRDSNGIDWTETVTNYYKTRKKRQ